MLLVNQQLFIIVFRRCFLLAEDFNLLLDFLPNFVEIMLVLGLLDFRLGHIQQAEEL